ncbi:hypothetical protein D0O09_03875 [Pseudomonas putida]|nr:hypothetical protein D0O09_03875 [Pseudomonas putida]
MTPLQRLEALDQQLIALERGKPELVGETEPAAMRQRFFGDLAAFWNDPVEEGQSRFKQLRQLRHEQLLAELELRLADQTLDYSHISLLRTSLELPLPWQRNHLPETHRAQVYRPVFNRSSPHGRLPLPGVLVLVADAPQGVDAEPVTASGIALLCSVSHGVEGFANLAELHTELCERLDDPLQSRPLLQLLPRLEDQQLVRCADRLRYEWFTGDLVEQQVTDVLDAQHQRLTIAWHAAWTLGQTPDLPALKTAIAKQQSLIDLMGSQYALSTRYALLLEKNLPAWLRESSTQSLTHIMQTIQELAGAIAQAAAPGLLTLEQFRTRHHLLAWVRERLGEALRREFAIELPAEKICVSVTLARRKGPLVNPLAPSGYVAVVNRRHVGDTVELVPITYRLDELALLNIAWFDLDYWLTARVHHEDGSPLDSLSPEGAKRLVRKLDAGSGYISFLRTHLLESSAARWRMQAHGNITRTRMHAEAAKARYARHLLEGTQERGYRWIKAVINHPDNRWRPAIDEQRVMVHQLTVDGHTLQGVLLIKAQNEAIQPLVLYTPDAPDRRAWREYPNTRALLKMLRRTPALRRYLVQRAPLADGMRLDRLIRKGRLGPHVQWPKIEGNLFEALYRAQVQAMIAEADANSRSHSELLGEIGLATLHLTLDMISLVLPAPALSSLAFGRMSISVWDGFEAMNKQDHEAMLHHAIAAFSHATDGLTSFASSPLMRRAMRGLPPQPPRPLPTTHEAAVDVSKLRYRIDGVHGEEVYEQINTLGPVRYFVKDSQGRMYNVHFDGHRWRVLDPRQPDAYVQLPIKRLRNGNWVVDSIVLWHDGLPDVAQLLEDVRLQPAVEGEAVAGETNLYDAGGQLYLQLGTHQLPVRRHLLAGHYHLQLPEKALGAVHAWAVLRQLEGQWRIRVRQPGRSSDWLALPAVYSASLGSSRSSR